ncbi:MlaA family lipoprotein [Acidihalobacter prosperus]|nr:VacJ family lipoprotein [Acidihalobacter prosperus]
MKRLAHWAVMLLLPVLGGCATTQAGGQDTGALSGYNHAMFRFNMVMDKAVLRPVAKGYVAVTPRPVRHRVANFFSNLGDVPVTVNALLQFKLGQAARDLTRLVFNSTFGLFGLFDVASGWGLPQHEDDLGMTLARWGVPQGPYIILPFFGPSTLRNSLSPLVDGVYLNPLYYYPDTAVQWSATALKVTEQRAQLLPLDSSLDQAYDPYTFLRNAYLQHRRYVLEQNNPKPVGQKPALTPLQQQLLEMQGGQ